MSWYKKNKSNCGTEMEYMVFTVSLNIIINPHNRKKMYVCTYVRMYVRMYVLPTDIRIEIKKYVKVVQSVGRKLLYM